MAKLWILICVPARLRCLRLYNVTDVALMPLSLVRQRHMLIFTLHSYAHADARPSEDSRALLSGKLTACTCSRICRVRARSRPLHALLFVSAAFWVCLDIFPRAQAKLGCILFKDALGRCSAQFVFVPVCCEYVDIMVPSVCLIKLPGSQSLALRRAWTHREEISSSFFRLPRKRSNQFRWF